MAKKAAKKPGAKPEAEALPLESLPPLQSMESVLAELTGAARGERTPLDDAQDLIYRAWDAPTPDHGMPESEPLPALVSRALGGVESVEALEAAPLGEVLEVIGRPDIARRLDELGAAAMLDVADHREQSAWLYSMPEIEMDARVEIFNLILEAEYYQQLHEWLLLGRALDEAVDASLRSAEDYPSEARDRKAVAKAFWSGLRGS